MRAIVQIHTQQRSIKGFGHIDIGEPFALAELGAEGACEVDSTVIFNHAAHTNRPMDTIGIDNVARQFPRVAMHQHHQLDRVCTKHVAKETLVKDFAISHDDTAFTDAMPREPNYLKRRSHVYQVKGV